MGHCPYTYMYEYKLRTLPFFYYFFSRHLVCSSSSLTVWETSMKRGWTNNFTSTVLTWIEYNRVIVSKLYQFRLLLTGNRHIVDAVSEWCLYVGVLVVCKWYQFRLLLTGNRHIVDVVFRMMPICWCGVQNIWYRILD